MKQAVKTIVDSIEKEINTILENSEKSEYVADKDFEFGGFEYEINLNDSWNKYEEVRNNYLTLEVKSVAVTNENSKVLTNLSTEVFNQLETTYTNY
jgi:hypothetical protein